MNPIALVLLSVTGLLGVYLYLLYGDQHQERQREAVIHHRLESERFDADFRNAFNGQQLDPDPGQADRIKKLEAEARGIEARRLAAEEEARRKAAELKKSIEEMAK